MTAFGSMIYKPENGAVLFQFSRYPQFLTGKSFVRMYLFSLLIFARLFVNRGAKLQKKNDCPVSPSGIILWNGELSHWLSQAYFPSKSEGEKDTLLPHSGMPHIRSVAAPYLPRSFSMQRYSHMEKLRSRRASEAAETQRHFAAANTFPARGTVTFLPFYSPVPQIFPKFALDIVKQN